VQPSILSLFLLSLINFFLATNFVSKPTMGKATKRKNRHRYKGKGGGGGTSTARDNSIGSGNGSSGILGRIRHGDPKIRQGTLSALSATTLSAEALGRGEAKPTSWVKDDLLRAVSERILDPDVPVAICAAGCLSNYAQFSPDLDFDAGDPTAGGSVPARNPAVLASIGEVILGRLGRVQDDVARLGGSLAEAEAEASAAGQDAAQSPVPAQTPDIEDDAMEASVDFQKVVTVASSKKKKKSGKGAVQRLSKREKLLRSLEEQFSLADLCLEALAALVERSPQALERIEGGGHAALLRGTSGTVSMCANFLSVNSSGARQGSAGEGAAQAAGTAASAAGRALHSALDENPALLSALLAEPARLTALASAMEDGNLPSLARIHCAGCLVTSRHLLPGPGTDPRLAEMDAVLTSRVFPILLQYLDYNGEIAHALIRRVAEQEAAKDAEMEDERIEREIVKKIDDRKESARSIARRQKAKKAKAKEDAAASGEKNNGNTGSNNGNGGTGEEKMEEAEIESAADSYDRAVEAWRSSCLPLKLAVEVTANLCAGSTSSAGASDQEYIFTGTSEDDEMMWDSDDEARLVAGGGAGGTGSLESRSDPRDDKLMSEVVRSTLPNRVVGVLSSVATSSSYHANVMPQVVADDLVELLSKSGVCVSNAAFSVTGWVSGGNKLCALWSCLRNLVANIPASVPEKGEITLAAVASAAAIMVALLRSRQALPSLLGEEDLKAILGMLQVNGNDQAFGVRRDAVSMLGILCSAPHPPEVNAMVCDAFLAALTCKDERVAVLSELLDALMVMYSADETDEGNHEAIFREKNVIGAFQHVLPIFKRKLKAERRSAEVDEFETWKETSLNARRFIDYKRGNA